MSNLNRQQKIELALALAERDRRVQRRKQSQPAGGLLEFVKYFWHVLEPVDEMVQGWPLECLCAHLEAVTMGARVEINGEDRPLNRLWINVPPGFMKALDCDTPVLTTRGWKRHGDLVVGDFVYGPDGQPKKVLARTINAPEESYSVEFDDGASVAAGAGHLWLIERDEPNQGPEKRGFWQRIERVVTTKNLANVKKFGSRTARDRIRLSAPIKCGGGVLPIDPYLLGVWLGDGFSQQGVICCGNEDLEHFLKLGRLTTPTSTANRIQIDGLTTALRLNGLLHNKHIPLAYLLSNVEQRWELLRGLMDTDGQVSEEGYCRFTSGNRLLVDGFVTLASSLGLKPRIGSPFMANSSIGKECAKNGPYFRVRFTPPAGSVIFNLRRKQARLDDCGKSDRRGVSHRYITNVRVIGERLVNCIQVEGGLYVVTDRFVPTHNSMLTNVMWPAWEWGPMNKPHLRYVAFSYSPHLTERDNAKFRDLIISQAYRDLWGHVFSVVGDGKVVVSNNKTGYKFATSLNSVGTGERGHRVILDDLHKIKGTAETDEARASVTNWVREGAQNRLNDIKRDAIVGIMQRVHENDSSGIVQQHLSDDYCSLIIPMEYESGRHFSHYTGWNDGQDPRSHDGELAWPDRFGPRELASFRANSYLWAGQYQQSPVPRGGGLFKDIWWQPYPIPSTGNYDFTPLYTVASLDTAFKEKEESDYSALTVWSVYEAPKTGHRRIMLVDAWKKKLPLHGARVERKQGEDERAYLRRAAKDWGLCEWVAFTCAKRRINSLLIEDSARGTDVTNEIKRIYADRDWGVTLIPARGDKWTRAHSIVSMFVDDMIYAPGQWTCAHHGKADCKECPQESFNWNWRDWVQTVIDEMCVFPRGAHDDLVDSSVQALRYLRDQGLAVRREEKQFMDLAAATYKPPSRALYDV